MKAVMKIRPEPGITMKDVDIPKPTDTEILVKVMATAICGSDLHLYYWDEQTTRWKSPLPMIIGHEFSGEVIEVGKAVHSIEVGHKVAAESHIPCQTCHMCKTGRMHICENMKIYGIQTPQGSFAEYTTIPESIVYRLPDDVSYEEGALFEPFGVAVHAIERAQIQPGDSVTVLGTGPIGLFCVQLAKICGAAPVIASEMKDYRLKMAESLGAADVIINAAQEDVLTRVMEITSGRGTDVVIEAAGSNVTVKQSFDIAGKNGRIVLMGLPTKSTEIETTSKITYKEANIFGTTGRLMYQTWERMSRIIANKRIDLTKVVTHRLQLTKADDGFRAIIEGSAGKVLLIP